MRTGWIATIQCGLCALDLQVTRLLRDATAHVEIIRHPLWGVRKTTSGSC